MRKLKFTLIEIVVSLALLAMLGSLLIYKGAKLLQEKRFSTSIEGILSEIDTTRRISLNYQIDIELVLEQKNGKIYLSRKTDFPPLAIKALFQPSKPFSEVVFAKKDETKTFYFYGNGWVEGEEKLILSMASHLEKKYSIDIKHSFRKVV